MVRHIRRVLSEHDGKYTMIRRGLVSLTTVLLLAIPILGGQAGQGGGTASTLQAMLAVLPNAKAPALDQTQALWLATMPLSCIDHPQAPPTNARLCLGSDLSSAR